jgi:cell division septum initiation protein DivIVA
MDQTHIAGAGVLLAAVGGMLQAFKVYMDREAARIVEGVEKRYQRELKSLEERLSRENNDLRERIAKLENNLTGAKHALVRIIAIAAATGQKEIVDLAETAIQEMP